MNELHKLKIVHRDIKPNNILLQVLPTGEHVYKLTDFGAARQVEMEDDQFTSVRNHLFFPLKTKDRGFLYNMYKYHFGCL